MLSVHWAAIEADLQDLGIDVGSDEVQHGKSWRWLQARIVGLLTRPVTYAGFGTAVPANRLQAALMPEPSNEPHDTNAATGG